MAPMATVDGRLPASIIDANSTGCYAGGTRDSEFSVRLILPSHAGRRGLFCLGLLAGMMFIPKKVFGQG